MNPSSAVPLAVLRGRLAALAGTPLAMVSTGLAVLLVGAWGARRGVAAARGLERIVALGGVCFAVPLAVFGALHLAGPALVQELVPPYMPWRMFWVYAVGAALAAAALGIATGIAARWAGLLFGTMMFLFVAMIYLPGALQEPRNRIIWTLVFRELSFGGAAWLLSGLAPSAKHGPGWTARMAAGRACVAAALLLFGAEHFLHPLGLPGVPLRAEMPAWIPGRVLLGWTTGAALLLAGASVPLRWRVRTVASLVGGWLLLEVLAIYGPYLATALCSPDGAVQVRGINYFADTLLFAGVVLALARAAPAATDTQGTSTQAEPSGWFRSKIGNRKSKIGFLLTGTRRSP